MASEVDWTGVLEGGGGGGGGGTSGGGTGGGAGVVLNDRLMTEASLGVISQLSTLGSFGGFSSLLSSNTPLESSPPLPQHPPASTDTDAAASGATAATDNSPVVKVEHSYSLSSDSNQPHSPLSGEYNITFTLT